MDPEGNKVELRQPPEGQLRTWPMGGDDKYDSGHEGDACLAGFSSRKAEISLYLMPGLEAKQTLLAALGKHKAGKGCLYVKRLSDVDVRVLEKLVRESVAELRRRYPKQAPPSTARAAG